MEKVFCVYHIGESDDLSDGYIGITLNLRRRFSAHKHSDCNNTVKDFISNNNLTYKDVTILLYASKEYCVEIERKLRPRMNIGWNIAKGGGGANNIGENAYNYNPDIHHPCEGGCGKTISSKISKMCRPCRKKWFEENAKINQPAICIDCGKDKTKEVKCVLGRPTRCRECLSIHLSKVNPSKILEPYHIYNISTGEKLIVDSDNIGIFNSKKAGSRLASLRTRVVNGDAKNGRESWNDWVIDETPYGRYNFTIKKKRFKLSSYGIFYNISEAAKKLNLTASFIYNRLHRPQYEDWLIIEYDILKEIKETSTK